MVTDRGVASTGIIGTVAIDSSYIIPRGAPLGGRRKRGAFNEAIGRSRGGRTTKINALTDDHGRPRVLALTMVFKMCQSASKKWRRVNGSHQLAEIIQGVKFKDGEKLIEHAA